MALQFIEAVDLGPYAKDIRDAQSLAFSFEPVGSEMQGILHDGFAVFSDERDRIFTVAIKTGAVNDGLCYFDPLLIGTAFPNAFAVEQLTNSLHMGTLDPSTGVQNHYHRRTSAAELHTLNAQTLAVGGAVFPTADEPGGLTFGQATGVAIGNPGHWGAVSNRDILIFEGLTDGISGETVLASPNIYPAGLALLVTDTGTKSTADDADNAVIWIDLDAGRNVGFMPASGRATNAVTEPNSEGPIAGETFRWSAHQYIPDDDATLAIPKGELLMVSRDTPEDTGVTTARIMVRFMDFNPLGVVAAPGAPSRVHGRVTLTSRINAKYDPIFDVAGAPDGEGANYFATFHPPTRRLLVFLREDTLAIDTTSNNRSYVGTLSRAVDPIIVTNPAPRSVPRTNDITTFETFVGGDIGEPVQGESVAFTLERVTTVDEVIPAAERTFPGTSNLDNSPIDANAAGDPEGTLVLVADASTLVETTDYTVVLATGVITWVTDQSGKTLVTASYEHRETAASPPFGTLLVGTASTDTNGIARTQVQYPDNDAIVGEIDKLSSAAV